MISLGISTSFVSQLTIGFAFLNHGYPRIMSSQPRLVTFKFSKNFWPCIDALIEACVRIMPFLFGEPSTFRPMSGWARGLTGILCLVTKAWFTNDPSAPESRSAVVPTVFSHVMMSRGRCILVSFFEHTITEERLDSIALVLWVPNENPWTEECPWLSRSRHRFL